MKVELRMLGRELVVAVTPPPDDLDEATALIRVLEAAPELLASLRDVLGLLDSGWLVRDTAGDGAEGWALRQVEPVRKLATAVLVVARAEGR